VTALFRLEVKKTIPLLGNTVFLCKMRNTLVDKRLMDESVPLEERVRMAAPVVCLAAGEGAYYPVRAEAMGTMGEWKSIPPRLA